MQKLSLIPILFSTLFACTADKDAPCEQESITLLGTVHDKDGLPFANANIYATVSDVDDTPDGEVGSETTLAERVTTTSGADGSYSLTVSVGTWIVWAWMEGQEDTGIGGGFACVSEKLQLSDLDCLDLSQDFLMDSCNYDD
jgi:hypothetical protein